ncbi:MAG: hypothetical protein JSU65_04865 [Candidatus Zixiibacteriota bacterium]|nr:MAG: hypothetical protein JSU65_04865 [candidate division Zixibacteria bacterium]
MRATSFILLAVALILGAVTIPAGRSQAQVVEGVPQLISYQGRLTDTEGDPVTDGEYLVTFAIWSDSISTAPTDREWISPNCTVLVVNGLFNWQLGSQEGLPPWTIANDDNLWLGIQIESDPEITPRTRLCSAPYAYKAWRAKYAEYADSAGVAIGLGLCAETGHYTTQSWYPPPASINANEIKLLFCRTFSNTDNLHVSLAVVVTTGTCAGYPGRVSSMVLAPDYAVVALQGWNGSSWTDLSSGDEVDVAYVAFGQ